ncbi:MAG: hypothetical protein RIG63_10005 [Coleofasciculus chthonoplastes F3-SA18-01]|uniref:hypothetical protein n=1 Tax=Coleofasciculus chthonoplastes TaxID=64178 RepID=UPI0032F0DE2B
MTNNNLLLDSLLNVTRSRSMNLLKFFRQRQVFIQQLFTLINLEIGVDLWQL